MAAAVSVVLALGASAATAQPPVAPVADALPAAAPSEPAPAQPDPDPGQPDVDPGQRDPESARPEVDTAQLPPADPPLVPPPDPVIADVPLGWPTPPASTAAAWLLVEADTGQVLAARRGEQRRAVASTVKVLTALTVVRRTDLDEVVTVGPEVADTVGATISLQPGDQLTVEQLLLGLLVRSGNDAAEALAAHVAGDVETFLALMRDDAAALGLDTTGPDAIRLVSVSGLDDANQLSAHDLSVLGRVALADPELRPLLAASEASLPRVGTDRNRNLLVREYPGATGVKTGFTAAAGNSLIGSAARGGRELVVVVLDGGDDPARFEQAAALLDHGFGDYTRTEVAASRTLLVAGGRRSLALAPVPVTVPEGAQVVVALTVPPRLEARVGPPAQLEVDGRPVGRLPTTVEGGSPAPVEGAAVIGRGAVDGVHAALRATLASRSG